MIAIVLGSYPEDLFISQYTPFDYGLYDALSRVGWPIALSYIIFACVHDSSGPVNWFLSHRLWQPASRLCYAFFYTHILILWMFFGTLKSPFHISILAILRTFSEILIPSVLLAIVFSLAFEMPIMNIDKLIFNSKVKVESVELPNKNK